MHLVIPDASALSDAAVQALGTSSLANRERLRGWSVRDGLLMPRTCLGDGQVDLVDAAQLGPTETMALRRRGWASRAPSHGGTTPAAPWFR